MTTFTDNAGTAELLLISDFPIDDSHLECVRQLFGESTSNDDIEIAADRRICRWPLRVKYEVGDVGSLSFHVSLCAMILASRRAVVTKVHRLGCNLEIVMHVPEITEYFSLAAATMKMLSDLEIQFAILPSSRASR